MTYESPAGSALATSLLSPLRVAELHAAEELIEFLELGFTPLDMATVLEFVAKRSPDRAFNYIVTPNVDHVVRLQRTRSDLWPAYRGAWMTLCDSRILGMLARAVGSTLPIIPGSDLTVELFERGMEREDAVAILGGSAKTVSKIADRYQLRNVRHYNPPMGFIRDQREVAKAVRFLVEARARYAFLAVGSPQQEIVAHRVAQTGEARGIGFCVGASLEFLSGEQTRAPALMQYVALEWMHRLASNPLRLWRRYLVDGPQIFLIHRAWRRSMR